MPYADRRGAAARVTSLPWEAVTGRPAAVAEDEAEAGTATTPRLWSSERVRQAVVEALVSGAVSLSAHGPTRRAVTAALPVAVQAQNQRIFPTSGAGWTLDAGAAARGYSLVGGGANPDVGLPLTFAEDHVDGYFLAAKVAGAETHFAKINLGPGGLTMEGMVDVVSVPLFFQTAYTGPLTGINADGAARCIVNLALTKRGYASLQVRGQGTGFPAHSTIELYEGGIFVSAG